MEQTSRMLTKGEQLSQVGKVYVQDRLRETGDLVWRLLQVC